MDKRGESVCLFVRRDIRRDEEHSVQREASGSRPGKRQVSIVDWVEGPTEKPNVHVFSGKHLLLRGSFRARRCNRRLRLHSVHSRQFQGCSAPMQAVLHEYVRGSRYLRQNFAQSGD